MKNIYLFPTKKLSSIYTNRYGELKLFSIPSTLPIDSIGSNQHLYITANVKVSAGDYYITTSGTIAKADIGGAEAANKFKNPKIVLATDLDLIADGVQAIDTTFLEWFVKNPTCEDVETKPLLSNNGRALFGYKIIIDYGK